MKDMSINNPFRPIAKIIRRTNLVIFIVIVAVGLSAYVLTMTNIIQKASEENLGTNNTKSTQIDKTITSKLNSLKSSSNNTQSVTLPSGRINPFN